jgi:hypothetical protein
MMVDPSDHPQHVNISNTLNMIEVEVGAIYVGLGSQTMHLNIFLSPPVISRKGATSQQRYQHQHVQW